MVEWVRVKTNLELDDVVIDRTTVVAEVVKKHDSWPREW